MYSIFIMMLVMFLPLKIDHEPVVFDQVDLHARQVTKSESFEKTAEELASPFDSEAEKARALFIWITDNIRYDIGKYKEQQQRNSRQRIVAESREALERIKEERRIGMAQKAFKSGQGVCEDYSYLFKYMCEHIGLEAEFIPGYARFSANTINRVHQRSNHAWNAVKIDEEWYLLDATWAAGNTDIKNNRFTKNYKEGLFMTPPEIFLLTHFPDDPAWQLLENPMDKKQFSTLPYAFPGLADPNIIDYFPKKGMLNRNATDLEIGLSLKDTTVKYVLIEDRVLSDNQPEITGQNLRFRLESLPLQAREITIAVIDGSNIKPLISYLVD